MMENLHHKGSGFPFFARKFQNIELKIKNKLKCLKIEPKNKYKLKCLDLKIIQFFLFIKMYRIYFFYLKVIWLL